MKRTSREDGITLIELLAALTILSIVIVLSSSIFFGGFNYSKKANETVSLQQEANLIITTINKFHESGYDYTIEMDHNPSSSFIKLVGKNVAGSSQSMEFSNSTYEYSLYSFKGNVDTPLSISEQVFISEPLYIKLVIKNKKHPSQHYDVKTIINRL